MTIFHGVLLSTKDDEPVAQYLVRFNLTSIVTASNNGKKRETLSVPMSTSARSGTDGRFQTIDIAGELRGPVEIIVSAPNGVEVRRQRLSLDKAQKELNLRIKVIPPVSVAPSDDPRLGQRLRLNGHVIDERGRTVPAHLPVVIWGVDQPETGTEPAERPLLVTETQANGLFSDEWPTQILERAFGRVAGGPPSPIPLDENRRLVRQILLVINLDDIKDSTQAADSDCNCDIVPRRAPEQADLTSNPGAFSQDMTGGCVDLTMPNRALEEFSYFTVVRTSEPTVKGVTLGVRRPIPRDLLVDLLGVSVASMVLERFDPAAVRLPTANLRLDVRTARSLVRQDRPPSLAEIERAAWLSEVAETKEQIDAGVRQSSGQVELDASHPIDWDDTPTIHLATGLAHGHILRYREVWRADGYSLGDLLYSLPLAPMQRRQIAVVDWDRRSDSEREEQLEFEEEIDALLSRDRDIQEIVGSELHEETSAGSSNTTWGAAGGIGAGFITGGFGIFGGVAGGGSGSDTESWQNSSRQFSADSLQRLRDRVSQRSSSVRSERSTVVQTVSQGETLRAETEVVANYNHCHAITIEYFEVLRHFLVTHELADVQECLFVPLPLSEFDRGKALRWREPLSRYLKDRKLRPAFTAIERIADHWVGWDFPEARYSEEAPKLLEGELRISFLLPRPRDDEDGKYQVDAWRQYSAWLPVDALELFTARMNERAARERDLVFRQEVAPEIAKNLVQNLHFAYVSTDGGETEIPMDATLVSRYHESEPLYVSLNPAGNLPNVPREDIAHFKIWFEGSPLPPDAQVIVHSGRVRYRTEHLVALLFHNDRILDDLREGDPVVISTPVSRAELRNPRKEDYDLADRLVEHLNKHLEFYHQAIWLSLDPQRRYMLLDAVLMPGLDGRSVASVCVNEVIGTAGNSLILPVAPGQRLDPLLKTVDEQGNVIKLENAYTAPPAPPLRVSVPTRGVYAEAIAGECNSCEQIDDSRYWRWTTEGQLALPGIETVSTGSRATEEPDLTPTELPKPLVSIQNAPQLPDPFGLSAAFQLLSKPELFRDITGLEGTQRNARAAFDAAISAASAVGDEAFKLARQNELARNAERMLNRINQAQKDDLLSPDVAQELANSTLRGFTGEGQADAEQPTKDETVGKVLDQSAQARSADIKVSTPNETVEVSFEDDEPVVGGAVVTGILDIGPDKDKIAYIDQDIVQEDVSRVAGGALRRTETRINDFAVLEAVKGTGYVSSLKAFKFIRPNPADTSKIQLLRRLRIVYPAVAGSPDKVAGKGVLPVVVLVHGNHNVLKKNGTEIFNHQGYHYLQEVLAQNNIVSISVDTNIANIFDSLTIMRAEMILGALDALSAMNDNKASPLHKRLDFKKVMLFGHSRGGDAVIHAAILNAARTPPKQKYGIQAVCSLSPSDYTGTLESSQVLSLDATITPFLSVIYGALDGDMAGYEGAKAFGGTGFRHYDRASCNKSMIFIDRCNHNRFNREWTEDDDGMVPEDLPKLLPRTDHEQLLKEFVGGLALWKLLDKTAQRGLFDGSIPNKKGAGISLQWSFGSDVKTLDEMEDPLAPDIGTRTRANSSILKLPDVIVGGQALASATNHTTGVLVVQPNVGPALPAEVLDLPPDAQDWSSFDMLTFRVGAVYDLNSEATINAGPLPEFSISIIDTAGGRSTFQSTALATVTAPRRPVFHIALNQIAEIVSSSADDPTKIVTKSPHGLTSGAEIVIKRHAGSTPSIDGVHKITVISPTSFTIPVKVTSGGSRGAIMVRENCTALRLETMQVDFAQIRLDPNGVNLASVRQLQITPPPGFPKEMFFDSLQLIRM